MGAQPVHEWFSDKMRQEALRALHDAERRTTDDEMSRVLKKARKRAYLDGWSGQTPPADFRMTPSDAEGLLNTCPDEIKRKLIVDAANPAALTNEALEELLVRVHEGLLEAADTTNFDEAIKWRKAAREILRKQLDSAARDDSDAVDELKREAVRRTVEQLNGRLIRRDARTQIRTLGEELGFCEDVITSAQGATRKKPFDITKLNGGLEGLLQREHRRQNDPPFRAIEHGIGFLDETIRDEYTAVADWLMGDAGKGKRSVLVRLIKRRCPDSLVPYALFAEPEIRDAADRAAQSKWIGRDQLELGPEFEPESTDAVERYCRTILRSKLDDWRRKFGTVPVPFDRAQGEGEEPGPSTEIPDKSDTAQEALDDRDPGSELELNLDQAVEILTRVKPLLRRAGIELAGVAGDVPAQVHSRTRPAVRDVLDLTVITVMLQQEAVEEAQARLRTNALDDDSALRAACDVVGSLRPTRERITDRTRVVFEAMKLLRPSWVARYGAKFPLSNSKEPGAEKRLEGSDYQDLYRRAHGLSDSPTYVVRKGVSGLLAGLQADIDAVVIGVLGDDGTNGGRTNDR